MSAIAAMAASTKMIVFDWNSTLFNDIDALVDCLNIILESHGREPVDLARYQTHYEVPFDKLYRNHGFSEADIGTILAASQGVFHDHYEPRAATAGLREGAAEVLRYAHMHNIKSYILSNHLVEPIRNQLRRLEIDTLFSEVLAYADRATQFRDMTKGQKLQRYISDNDLTACDKMIVGDSVEEIEIGRAQGMISVAITGGCVSEARLRSAKPDYLIHALPELTGIMQERGFAS
jgi:phosphoglycolate phosphatase